MALDTPAQIAIIGAGPLGLEAALYARYLGYQVDLYEQDDVAARVMAHAASPMPSTLVHWTSPLGLAALEAQGIPTTSLPLQATITFGEWAECYLLPLAQSDLLQGKIHPATRVLVARGATVAEWEDVQASSGDPSSDHEVETDELTEEEDDYEEIIPLVLELQQAADVRLAWADLVIAATGSSDHSALFPSPLPHMHGLTIPKEGVDTACPMVAGRRRIRDLFAVIADRESLDLYKSYASSSS